jgi:hypothetical protein
MIDGGDDDVWSSRWNDWQAKLMYSEIICPGTASSTTNPTLLDLSSNKGLSGRKHVTNRQRRYLLSPS